MDLDLEQPVFCLLRRRGVFSWIRTGWIDRTAAKNKNGSRTFHCHCSVAIRPCTLSRWSNLCSAIDGGRPFLWLRVLENRSHSKFDFSALQRQSCSLLDF